MSTRNVWTLFALSFSILLILFFPVLRSVLNLSLHDQKYSHLIIILPISLFFIWRDRKSLPSPSISFSTPFLIFLSLSLLTLISQFLPQFKSHSFLRLDIAMLSFLLFTAALATFFFSFNIVRNFTFSWFFLILLIPVPELLLDYMVEFFRYGSAEVVDRLFTLLGMTYIRNSLTFHLPNISIFIAKECSGIRSSIALMITVVLAGKMLLRTAPGKISLLFFIPLLTILKNGIRITTLTFLANNYDTKWLTNSHLHHDGGIVFFGIILLILFLIITVIQKIENRFLTPKPSTP